MNNRKQICVRGSYLLYVVVMLFIVPAIAMDESKPVFTLAQRFFSDSLYNLALEQFQKYLSLKDREPEFDPIAYYNIALCHYNMENVRKAAEAFDEYIKLFPGDPNVCDAMYFAGMARKAGGDFKEASDLFFGVWSRFVGSARATTALFEAADCAWKDKNAERAIELFSIFLSRFPTHENAKGVTLALLSLYIEQKDYAQAEYVINNVSKQWLADGQFKVRTLYYRALLNQRMQKAAKAEELYREMSRLETDDFPEAIRAYTEYIGLLAELKKYAEASTICEKQLALFAKRGVRPDRQVVEDWAEYARRARQYGTAERAYRRLLAEYGGEVPVNQINFRIAECQAGQGDTWKAIETLRQVESAESSDEYTAKAVKKMGDLYFAKDAYSSAIAAYRRYLELDNQPEKDRVIFRIGKIYQEKFDRCGAALREFENLLKWYPASPLHANAVMAIAECCEKTGEYQQAIRQYEYLVESSADEQLVDQARTRVGYLKTFRIRNADAAAYKLAGLMRRRPDSISTFERLRITADIYEQDLKDFGKALETYESLLALDTVMDDSVKARVMLWQGRVYQKLYEKAQYENEPATAAHAMEKAIAVYRSILQSFASTPSADEAAYSVLALTSPGIKEYEAFIDAYPQSVRLPDVLFAMARHYEERSAAAGRKYDEKTAAAYRRIVRNYPSSPLASPALIGMARNYLAAGELDSVENAVAMHLEKYPNSEFGPEALYMSGVVAKRRGKYAVAEDIFRQVLHRYPFSPFVAFARFELAYAQLETGRIFEALSNFRLYELNHPGGKNLFEARYGIAKCMLKIGKQEEAADMLASLLQEQIPDDVAADAHYELARIIETAGGTYAALNHYKSALAFPSFAKRTDVLEHVGRLYFDSRIYGDAAAAFREAIAFAASRADSIRLTTRAISSMIMDGRMKEADRAAGEFEKHFGKVPASQAEFVYYEGLHFMVEKEYDRAIKRFEYIVAKYSGSERCDDAAYQIPLAHFYAGRMDDALKGFYEFTVKYPQSEFVPLGWFKIGMIYHGKDEYAQAADYFTKAMEHQKVDSKTRFRAAYNAAVAYQKISAWRDAARMYAIVLNDSVNEMPASSLHLKIGFCLIQGSRIEEALEHFQKANVNPSAEDKPEILYWIATCYGKLGEYQRAITEYLKVPYLYSGIGKWGVTAEFEAARLYERQGDYAKALSLYKKIVRSDGEQGRFGRQAKERIQRCTALMAESQ